MTNCMLLLLLLSPCVTEMRLFPRYVPHLVETLALKGMKK